MDSNKNKFNKWLVLINIPIQMGIIIFIFSFFGKWLDGNSTNAYTKIVTLVGVFLALYNVIRQVNQLNKNDK